MNLSVSSFVDHSIDFMAMDVAVNAAAGALKAFFADLPEPLIPYSLHPELVEAASKNEHRHLLSVVQMGHVATAGISLQIQKIAFL